jgi:RES domain-containing protein
MLKEHPSFSLYCERLAQAQLPPWSGTIFRSATIDHGSAEDLISGHGSAIAGGRWNPPGLRAVYGSLKAGLSVDESFNAILRGFGFSIEDIHPRVIVGIELNLEAVFILKPSSEIPEWIDYDHLLTVDWRAENAEGRETVSQAFGRAVAQFGEALIMGSSVRPGLNIAIFPDSIRPGSIFRVIHGDELPG